MKNSNENAKNRTRDLLACSLNRLRLRVPPRETKAKLLKSHSGKEKEEIMEIAQYNLNNTKMKPTYTPFQ
jgi:hypothetical protein